MMKKLDVILAVITGEGVAGLSIWLVKNSPNINFPFLYWLLPVLLPVLAIFGIWISYLIGKKYLFVYQLAKFALIGAFFAIFDIVIFNVLIEYFGIAKEEAVKYTFFVGTSFVIATIAKYAGDKYWAFEQKAREGMSTEFGKFFIVTLISGGIQVVVASLVFNLTSPFLEAIVAGNIGKITGITITSVWNFVGYKFIVFKK